MSNEIENSPIYQQVDVAGHHLQQELDARLSQFKPDVNLAIDAFDVLWHDNPEFQTCSAAAILSSPVSYSPSPFQAYVYATQNHSAVAGFRVLSPEMCNNALSIAASPNERVLLDYIEDVRQAIPAYEVISKDTSRKMAVLHDVLQDASRTAASGVLHRAGLSVDGYIVATVCIPENIPTDYHRVLRSEGLDNLNICTPSNVATAKSELRFLCDSAESCDSLVNGLPRLQSAANAR